MVKKKNTLNRNNTLNKKNKIDGIVSLIASLSVLFTSLVDPQISIILAFGFLLLYSIYKLFFDKG
jgi:Ca2+/Na+ antiporter